MSKLSGSKIRQNIKKSIYSKTNIQVKSCYDPAGVAKYITKDMLGHCGVKIPIGYKGQGRRLTNCSKGFLSDTKANLWSQSKQRFTVLNESKLAVMEKKLGGAMTATVAVVPSELSIFQEALFLPQIDQRRWAFEQPVPTSQVPCVPLAFPATCQRNRLLPSSEPLDFHTEGISRAKRPEQVSYPLPKLRKTKANAGWKSFESEHSNRNLPNSLW